MQLGKLFYAMYKMKLLSPFSLYNLVAALLTCGVNVMALLRFAGKTYRNKVAFVDDYETVSYYELFLQAEALSIALHKSFQLTKGQKVGLLCRNHGSLVKSIFAVSRLGADIYLLNVEMSKDQLRNIFERQQFNLVIYDFELTSLLERANYKGTSIISCHDELPAINHLCGKSDDQLGKLPRTSMGKLILLTGGTTGKSKEVAHKPSLFNYLPPFLTLLTRVKLFNYKTGYIATPIFHGYGVAFMLLFIALGKKIVITKRFDATSACSLICEHQVEVVTVVPLMIRRMLKHNMEELTSLACIASGSAELTPNLVDEVFRKVGDVLYNLYGTSESGLNIIATPEDLKYSPKTLGKKINGVQVKLVDKNKKPVQEGVIGQFCMKNKWSMRNRSASWIETGDLGYQDKNGYYFLCGRADDMIVSAGINVYPFELEEVLLSHPNIEDVAVIGIQDEEFGQRLKAFVQLVKHTYLHEEELYGWLRPRIARYQVPKEIVFVESLPYTPLGKLDKKKLLTK
ncbi:AMP-binding protein [Fredinandcohnia humi]